jgi:hypothetical protein
MRPYLDVRLGPNWWSYFFQETPAPEYIAAEYLPLFASFGAGRPARIGNALVRRFMRVAPDVCLHVEAFVRDQFSGRTVYGLHYRGTDKTDEAPRIAYEFVLEQIQNYDPDAFFVASDEAKFIDFMVSHYPGRVVFGDAIRSTDLSAAHLDARRSDGYRLGREALIDCLLLSSCDFLIRTESNLSKACRFFNPRLQEMNLTAAFTRTSQSSQRQRVNGSARVMTISVRNGRLGSHLFQYCAMRKLQPRGKINLSRHDGDNINH